MGHALWHFCHYRMKTVNKEKQREEMGNLKRFNILDMNVPETRSIPTPSDIPNSCEFRKSSLGVIGFLYIYRVLLNTPTVSNKWTGSQKVFTVVVQ